MTRYSNYRPVAEAPVQGKETEIRDSFAPIAVVGVAVVAALMVLLLLTQSQLSQIGFEITALERELAILEQQHEKLLISHAEAYNPQKVEAFATERLGMVHPNPDQIRFIYIDTADRSRKEPK